MTKGATTNEDELIERWIEPNPNKPGADEVRIKGYGQSVWAIIGYLGEDGDAAEVARGYDIPTDAVEAARAYYRRHKKVIDNRLAANWEPDDTLWEVMSRGLTAEEQKLVARYIEPNPNRAGADEVRVRDHGMSVWAVIGYLGMKDGEPTARPEEVARSCELPLEAVKAAIAYYRHHREIIDNRLAANTA